MDGAGEVVRTHHNNPGEEVVQRRDREDVARGMRQPQLLPA